MGHIRGVFMSWMAGVVLILVVQTLGTVMVASSTTSPSTTTTGEPLNTTIADTSTSVAMASSTEAPTTNTTVDPTYTTKADTTTTVATTTVTDYSSTTMTMPPTDTEQTTTTATTVPPSSSTEKINEAQTNGFSAETQALAICGIVVATIIVIAIAAVTGRIERRKPKLKTDKELYMSGTHGIDTV